MKIVSCKYGFIRIILMFLLFLFSVVLVFYTVIVCPSFQKAYFTQVSLVVKLCVPFLISLQGDSRTLIDVSHQIYFKIKAYQNLYN